jgi:acetyl-CoA carboxylase biotin carboxyl carrier protein
MSDPDFDKTVATLIAEFSRSGIAELSIRQGDFEVYLSNVVGQGRRPNRTALRQSSPVAFAERPVAVNALQAESAASANSAELPANARIVVAPNLGTFYRAPKPGAANYVEVGNLIADGDELCLIEVMKLFTAVRADASGRLHAVLADDGSMVEAGKPLFVVVDA